MEITRAEQYLKKDAPIHLADLTEESAATWGKMTPQHMVEHLIITFKMSVGKINIPIVTQEEEWPATKAYLMKDSPMRRNVPSPVGNNELLPLRFPDLHTAKTKLLEETLSFLEFAREQPDFIANHPFGGPMKASEWLLFHRKHFKHHFIQFGLIEDYVKQ
ncbi:hypothetical protein [Roseivirga thermotolerans]|uniref:DUF1569 domain-containing protein n=1 Tax=Roseivirga thermotolerans TaxID=1758176 RepID=A0ABQ3I032_9BACT|nr:hypothetical protein [Roseivirga thermotolerans]GHE52066.1 hypothetical protein GCM10011340_02870 [Roseivirga thermotolerans]